jgi:N-formylglutamate amidohydrolase/predicted protein tyrosine phosphatase
VKIEIESRKSISFKAQKPFSQNTAIICITDTDKEFIFLEYPPEHILRLKFNDVTFELLDDYDDEAHVGEKAAAEKHYVFNNKQAEEIAAFVKSIHGKAELLICQCEYGQSRSAGIAAAIRQFMQGDGIEIFADKKYFPNKIVYRKVISALKKEMAQELLNNGVFSKKKKVDSHILLHIPHSSLNIPQNDRKYILLDDLALEKEKLIMTDRHLDDLCRDIPVNMLISEINRLVVDMERYDDDSQEPMAKHGMGVVYTSTHDEKPLRTVTDEYKAELIQKYYKPYHHELKSMCIDILDRHGECLIIDLHSFPSNPIFCYDYNEDLPDICIGFNGDGSPIINEAKRFFEEKGLTVKFNYPFFGAIIPNGLEGKVESIMIEVNRKLYMDEETGDVIKKSHLIKKLINDFIETYDYIKWRD